jgi:signal peptidase II
VSRERVSSLQRWALVLGSLVVVLVVDQLSKDWALGRLSGGRIVDVIGTLRFNLAFNTGMAFSKGSGSGAIIGTIALGIVVVLALVARKVDSRLQLVLIGIVMGGALGNVADRLFRAPLAGQPDGFMSGAVVDFIDVQFWPIWNVADMAVVVGGIMLAVIGAFAPVAEGDATEDDAADGSDGSDAIDGVAHGGGTDHVDDPAASGDSEVPGSSAGLDDTDPAR